MIAAMPAALTPRTFVAKWRKVALKESAAAKEHFIDLCRLLDHPTPADADADGTTFTFEYGAAKLGGGQGFADVFKRGFFGWEYKGKHANLDKAYQQLLQYREALHNPPLLVVSDIDTIVVHPNFINRANRPTTLTLDDLLTPAGMAALRAVFTDPHHFESPETPESVTQRIAGDFARIADRLRAAGHASPQIAHFLIRLLFCLFAEDVGLLPQGLFARLVERTRQQPAAFAMQLRNASINPPGASDADLKKRTLTNLYNARPTWLDNAHRKLDAAVFAAYGWPADLSDDEILARLLALNLARAGDSGS